LGRYAWHQQNSPETRASVCGRLKPNELGLFDLLGNVYEWCLDAAGPYSEDGNNQECEDTILDSSITNKTSRLLRGGTFTNRAMYIRVANRLWYAPSLRRTDYGFRLARTYP